MPTQSASGSFSKKNVGADTTTAGNGGAEAGDVNIHMKNAEAGGSDYHVENAEASFSASDAGSANVRDAESRGPVGR